MNQSRLTSNHSVATTMQLVLLALFPGALLFTYQNGWGAIVNMCIAVVSALFFESIAQWLRKRPISIALSDYTAVVTAILIALCLPPLIPWWITVLATGCAILLAKHAFGGVGYNAFNPAMVGYAIVLVSFPTELSLWLNQPDGFTTGLTTTLSATFNGGLASLSNWDALTGATSLDQHRDLWLQQTNLQELATQTQGLFGARQTEWISLAYLAGGLWLISKKIISWHIPVAFITALLLISLLHNLLRQDDISIPVYLFGGATMLGAFFISTDPVSAATSNRGRLLYAALTGVLVYLIRTYGSYPDGVAFAVLVSNCAVPMIDRLDFWLRRVTPHG